MGCIVDEYAPLSQGTQNLGAVPEEGTSRGSLDRHIHTFTSDFRVSPEQKAGMRHCRATGRSYPYRARLPRKRGEQETLLPTI